MGQNEYIKDAMCCKCHSKKVYEDSDVCDCHYFYCDSCGDTWDICYEGDHSEGFCSKMVKIMHVRGLFKKCLSFIFSLFYRKEIFDEGELIKKFLKNSFQEMLVLYGCPHDFVSIILDMGGEIRGETYKTRVLSGRVSTHKICANDYEWCLQVELQGTLLEMNGTLFHGLVFMVKVDTLDKEVKK